MAEEMFPEFRTCACDRRHGRIVRTDGDAEIEVCSIGMARKSLKAAISDGRIAPGHAKRLLDQIDASGLPRDCSEALPDIMTEISAWNSLRLPHDWRHAPRFTEACEDRLS